MSNPSVLQQYTEYMRGKVSDTSLHVYTHAVKMFLNVVDGSTPTPQIAQDYVDSLSKQGKSSSTVTVRAYAIMSYFRWQKVDVHLDCPPVSMKRPIYLKMPEVICVIDACQNQLERTVVVMLFDTAVRISELLNLNLDDIDWDIKAITVVRKGGRITEVNVSDKALIDLKKWLYIRKGSSKRVFLDMSYGDAWLMVKNIGKRTNIETSLHPHIFRHSRAIQMLRDRVPLNIVSQHLGHKSVTTTADIYGQFITPDLREMIPPW